MVPQALLLGCYELGHPPLSLAWPLAFLKQAGLPAQAIDLSVEPFSESAAAQASFVGISVPMHTALRLGVKVAARVRTVNPRAHICFYGLYAWLNAEFLLDGPGHSVLAGESEPVLVELVKALQSGADPSSVPGVSTRTSRAKPHLARLAFPIPDRSGLPPLKRYAGYVRNGRASLAAYVEASRGCRHLCRHCPVVPVYGGRFFVVPVETVRADVQAQVAAGARHITFGDPDFLNGPGHALRIARAVHAEFPDISFDFTAKIEHILKHSRLFTEFARLGCTFVVSAVESLSDLVLERLQKGHTAADVEEALSILDQAGIALHPTLVAFTPWTTLDDYIDQIEFFRTRGLVRQVPPIQLAIRLLVPPGSALLSVPETRHWIGDLDAEAFAYHWRHPDPRMDALYEEVAACVEAAEDAGRESVEIWEAVRELAYAAAGRAVPDEPMPPFFRPDPPRLTEHWFC